MHSHAAIALMTLCSPPGFLAFPGPEISSFFLALPSPAPENLKGSALYLLAAMTFFL